MTEKMAFLKYQVHVLFAKIKEIMQEGFLFS